MAGKLQDWVEFPVACFWTTSFHGPSYGFPHSLLHASLFNCKSIWKTQKQRVLGRGGREPSTFAAEARWEGARLDLGGRSIGARPLVD